VLIFSFLFLIEVTGTKRGFFVLLTSSSTSYSFLPVGLIILFEILQLEVVGMLQTGEDGSAKFT